MSLAEECGMLLVSMSEVSPVVAWSLKCTMSVSSSIDRKLVDRRSILFAEDDDLYSLMNYS